jgi:hypothetical protein
LYKSEKIRVACSECLYNCGGNCAPGYYWTPELKRCLAARCPKGYYKNDETMQCVKATEEVFVIEDLEVPTLDPA